jgi:ribonuclease VapC
MVIDTSALLAILQDEPERRLYNERIEAAAIRRLSTASFVEVSIVIEARYGPPGLLAFDRLVEAADILLVDVDAAQARTARTAFSRYGQGRHPAGCSPVTAGVI